MKAGDLARYIIRFTIALSLPISLVNFYTYKSNPIIAYTAKSRLRYEI